MSRLVVGAVLLLAAWQLVRLVWSWRRLRHIPGPPLARWSPAWLLKALLSGRFHERMREASDRYGPLVRIGPNDLLCTDPDVIRRISAVRSPYVKGLYYKTARIIPGYDNVVSQRDEAKHKALRAKMAGAFSGHIKEGGHFPLEPAVDRQLSRLIALIDDKYVSAPGRHRPLDLSTVSQYLALDIISDVSFGEAFGFLAEDRDLYSYVEISNSAAPAMNLLVGVPWLTGVLYRWPLRLALPSDGDGVGLGRLMGLARSCVEKRLRPDAEPGRDMLQAFINSGMSRDELVQHMFVQIVAGTITTAAAVRHTLLALASTPRAYAALQREVDGAVADGAASAADDIVSEARAAASPYLQSVVREGLRMWPPTTGLGSKQVPAGGDVVCGFAVPGGTQVAQNFFGLMRLKSFWGEDADVFRPERWLEAAAEEGGERLKKMNAMLDLNFGSGKYQCLGKPVAMMELNKVFFELFRRYDFAVTDPQNPIDSTSGTFWVAGHMWTRVTRREHTH